jgi:hypothetical protein
LSEKEQEPLRKQILKLTKQYAGKLLALKAFVAGEDAVRVPGKV